MATKAVPAFKTSGFAILDITTGRKALAKYTDKVGKVRADDGTSIEFACGVLAIKNVRGA